MRPFDHARPFWTGSVLGSRMKFPSMVYVGRMLGHLVEVSGGEEKQPQPKTCGLGLFWWHLKGYVGPMLGRFGSMLGPC